VSNWIMTRVFLYFVITILILSSLPVHAQNSVALRYLLSAINQERTSRGIAPVRLDTALTEAAVDHANLMADHGSISHRFPGELELSARGSATGGRFDRITENVGEGPTSVALHEAWMHSAGHRANILDPSVDAVGIAVVGRDGQLYAVQDFSRTVHTLTLEQQEAAVGILLDKAGLELLPDTDARRTCAMTSGYAGQQQPGFVVRYTTTDLTTFPSQLRTRLAKAVDRQASVGACPATGRSNFSVYSIAVLLYP
jgi:hypothetical protein